MRSSLSARFVFVFVAGIVAVASPGYAGPGATSLDGVTVAELPRRLQEIRPASPAVVDRVLRSSGTAAVEGSVAGEGVVLLVRSTGEDGVTPTDTDNDYTRIVDALSAAATLGDGTTIELLGTFDWTEPNAFADWAADDYGPVAPTGLADITLTAQDLGDAVIVGPGDPDDLDIFYEAFLYFFGGTYQGWTISNLDIRGFDWSLGFFFDTGGSSEDFNGLSVVNNRIEMPRDLNASVQPSEGFQNIGIHFAFGEDQLIMGNEIIIPGDSESNTDTGELAASVAMQSNTGGSDTYDGLMIVDNTVRVVNAPSIDPLNDIGAPFVLGIWENGHANTSDISVAGNSFLNEHPDNDPTLNLQLAFRVTSHSSAITTVLYAGNRVDGANIAFEWFSGGQPPSTAEPVELVANEILGNGTGIFVRADVDNTNARANVSFNRIVGNLIGVRSDDSHVVAENNWWGCNEGPDTADCDSTSSSWTSADPVPLDLLDADPWLVAELLLDPTMLDPGASTNVTVDLRKNSDAVDMSGVGTLPDGIPVALATTVDGTFASGTPLTVAGLAEDVLTLEVTADPSNYEVSATIDNEVLTTGLEVNCPTDLTIANTTITGTEVFRAANEITLGPSLTVDGTDIDVIAGQRVTIKSDTTIGGTFSIAIDPAACTL